ncbi:hypothetical protein [Glaesserella parasuis]|nr:hypothetical protein [Glaesserella parasuis]MDP0008498.1 hypothetical protein [Glaesserella parasuis]MDP0293580.1 hypothetical protein [Glaesserella parasuis]
MFNATQRNATQRNATQRNATQRNAIIYVYSFNLANLLLEVANEI